MKYFTFLLPLLLIACGEDGVPDLTDATIGDEYRQQCVLTGEESLVNRWFDVELNELRLRNDCRGITVDECNHVFDWYQPHEGQMLINVTSTNEVNASCLPIGETLCTVEHRDPNGSNEEI